MTYLREFQPLRKYFQLVRTEMAFNSGELRLILASIDFVGTKSRSERSFMNRDNLIKIRVSADELSAIKKRAADSDMTVRNFLCDLVHNGKIILYNSML